jgi:hypothetical protein
MDVKKGIGFKLIILAIVGVAAGWLVWKSLPPYEPGVHSTVAEASSAAEPGSIAEPVAAAQGKAVSATSGPPRIGTCQILPADNIWNTPIDKLKKSGDSDAYIGSIGPQAKLHPDFGANNGIPFTEVPPNTPKVGVTFEYADESDQGEYPIPQNAPIEGGPHSTGDRHVLLIDTKNCILYELFLAYPNPEGTWKAGSGAIFNLASNALRPRGWTSTDAAGLPVLPGLVRYDEVASGEIRHALRFTVPHTQGAYIWPARHKASSTRNPDLPPMGVRFRLRPDFDITDFSKNDRVILRALKRYGMFLADNGGSMFITGVPDKRWDDEELHDLNKVTAADFQAVDESGLQVDPDSARVKPGAVAP